MIFIIRKYNLIFTNLLNTYLVNNKYEKKNERRRNSKEYDDV